MNEGDIKRFYNYPLYPGGLRIFSDKGFVTIHNGNVGGTHWTCFTIKDNKSFHSVSFEGQPEEVLLNQLPKPKIYRKYEIQDIFQKLCGSYC